LGGRLKIRIPHLRPHNPHLSAQVGAQNLNAVSDFENMRLFLAGWLLLGLGVLGFFLISEDFVIGWFIAFFATAIGTLLVMQFLFTMLVGWLITNQEP
jgi:hypothetical protein